MNTQKRLYTNEKWVCSINMIFGLRSKLRCKPGHILTLHYECFIPLRIILMVSSHERVGPSGVLFSWCFRPMFCMHFSCFQCLLHILSTIYIYMCVCVCVYVCMYKNVCICYEKCSKLMVQGWRTSWPVGFEFLFRYIYEDFCPSSWVLHYVVHWKSTTVFVGTSRLHRQRRRSSQAKLAWSFFQLLVVNTFGWKGGTSGHLPVFSGAHSRGPPDHKCDTTEVREWRMAVDCYLTSFKYLVRISLKTPMCMWLSLPVVHWVLGSGKMKIPVCLKQ
jgi:hypothetical protein